MKKQKRIHKAYLKLGTQDGRQSVLIVVDYEGSREDLFQGIAEAASPYLQARALEVKGLADGAFNPEEGLRLFYKRKRFGLF
ncbi:enhanced serine sensitivity protein SseB C-terminal domain-containing protein [Paenibacillus sp. CC-CFT747]|nr:enhanced serine sensitivity protein SseB C-terminal domain-containing protein [Paenibacillus sp. CC-CFT747]